MTDTELQAEVERLQGIVNELLTLEEAKEAARRAKENPPAPEFFSIEEMKSMSPEDITTNKAKVYASLKVAQSAPHEPVGEIRSMDDIRRMSESEMRTRLDEVNAWIKANGKGR